MSEGSAEDVGATDSSISEGRDDQESYAQVDLDSSGSSGFPSTLRGVTQEGSTTVCQLDVGTGEATPCLLDPPSAESLGIYEPLLMSVLTQTDSSWLLSRSLKKTDTSQENLEHAQEASFSSGTSDKGSESFAEIDSILEDDVSDITSKGSLEDLIVHTEFIDDIKPGTLFGSTLYTLPSVGPPTILAYKQESREKPTNYNAVIPKVKDVWLQNIKDLHDVKEYWQWTRNRAAQKELAGTAKQFSQKGESADKPQNLTKRNGEHKWTQFRETVVSIGFDLCQFCGKNLKPLPTPKQLSIETPETLFCCKQYQDLFEFLMREEELIRLKSGLEIIDIAPHLPYSSLLEREQAKERAAMKLRDRALEKYLKSTKEGQSRFTGARKLTTITFQLSTSLDFVTLKDPELKDDEWDNIFTELGGDTFSWHKGDCIE
ncbi:glutamate-rich protein 6-like isoform X2 [Heptranchias perlo]|uniref:glutamate-rich protein 6-like isoform X2 n=1 Tax=Heptranchias perlo TaxID=212740 RepID=UPI0035594E69